jgi:hypothetical protein
MDRHRGTYFTLNEVGGRVWELIGAGATVAEVIERLLDEYDVPRARVEQDVAATLRKLFDDRLLTSEPPPVARPVESTSRPAARSRKTTEPGIPSVFRCGLLIAWFKSLLRIRGFLSTLEWIRRRVERLPATTEAELGTVKGVEYAVAMAGAFYPGRAKCLEQSLTLYYLLRRQGVAAVYCQGVQPYPFQAHAWIEYQGEIINDVPEHARFFARLPEQLP